MALIDSGCMEDDSSNQLVEICKVVEELRIENDKLRQRIAGLEAKIGRSHDLVFQPEMKRPSSNIKY